MTTTGNKSWTARLIVFALVWGVSSCGGPELVQTACNDGTGATDCCPEGIEAGQDCDEPSFQCWSRCSGGFRGQYFCDGFGRIGQGKGLLTCGENVQN